MYRGNQQPFRTGFNRTPYQTGRPAFSAGALLGQVLGITAGGFILTAATTALFPALPYGVSFGAMLLGFFVVFGVYGARSNPALSLGLFYLFTVIEGLAIAPIISRYVAMGGSQIVFNAAATTGVGMLVLGGIAFVSSFDFRRLTGVAFAALIGVMIVGLISAFTHFIHPETYAWGVLAVFSLLTLIDFARIRAANTYATPVESALAIYLDAINIFMALLQIFGIRSRDD